MIPRKLMNLALSVRWQIAVSILVTLVLSATYVSSSVAIALAVAAALRGSFDEAGRWLVVALSCIAGRALLTPVGAVITTRAGLAVRRRLRRNLLERIAQLGPEWKSQARVGRVQSTLVDAIDWLDPYYSVYLPQLAVTVTLPLAITGAVAVVYAPSASLLLVCVLVTLVVPRFKDAAMLRQGSERVEAYLGLSAEYLESMQGVPTLRTFGAGERRRDALEQRSHHLYEATMRPLKTSLMENGVTAGFSLLGIVGSVAVAAFAVAGETQPPMTALVVLMLSTECFRPVRDLAKAWHSGYLGLMAADSVDEVLDAAPAVIAVGTHATDFANAPRIEFDHVCYTHPGSVVPAVTDVTVTIPAGGLTVIVGSSGAGKSTLVSLLARRIDPDSGRVLLGGYDVRDLTIDTLRRQVAVVEQHCYLMHDTVASNIRLGAPDATDDDVRAALGIAEALPFVDRLPSGMHTLLAENGETLSGGQRQRLSIARALLRDTPVLVLDEPTSHLDEATDARLMANLVRTGRPRTVVVVAHRLDRLDAADHVIVMEAGRVVEHGRPTDLLARSGALSRLRRAEAERSRAKFGQDDPQIRNDAAAERPDDI